MAVLYLLVSVISCLGICYKPTGFRDTYLGRRQCNAIKGVFILLVFIRHIYPYIRKSGYAMSSFADKAGSYVDGYLGQLIVVMFLFYSGFGIWESIKSKGDGYIKKMPQHRILTTLVNFDVAVCFFIVTDVILERNITLWWSMLAMTGWESVGNSNWYILCILLCYTCVYVVARLVGNIQHRGLFIGGVIIGLCVILLTLSQFKQIWYYNTVMSFGAGCVYSNYTEKIERFLFYNYRTCLIILMVLLLVFLNISIRFDYRGLVYNLASITFTLTVLMVTMKIRIGNRFLYWLGVHLFPLYIYQRIPMIILYEIDGGMFVRNNVWLYIALCFITTLVIARFYKYWQIKF